MVSGWAVEGTVPASCVSDGVCGLQKKNMAFLLKKLFFSYHGEAWMLNHCLPCAASLEAC